MNLFNNEDLKIDGITSNLESNSDNKVTMVEFEKTSVYSLNIIAQCEFKTMFSKAILSCF